MKYLIFSMLFFCGCSVGMAMSGKHEPNLSPIRQGVSRSEIELQLGGPVKTASGPENTTVCMYEYERGNEPSAMRAMGHGFMDFLTLGLWEVIGTPIEGFQGEKYRLTITYDENDKAVKIE